MLSIRLMGVPGAALACPNTREGFLPCIAAKPKDDLKSGYDPRVANQQRGKSRT